MSHKTIGKFVVPESVDSKALLKAVDPDSSDTGNLIYISGGVATGKTLLLKELIGLIGDNSPESEILFEDTRVVLDDFIAALKNEEMPNFISGFHQYNVIALDNLEILSETKKPTTFEIFIHIIKRSLQNGCLIISSSTNTDFLKGIYCPALISLDVNLDSLTESDVKAIEKQIQTNIGYFTDQEIKYKDFRELEGVLKTMKLEINH